MDNEVDNEMEQYTEDEQKAFGAIMQAYMVLGYDEAHDALQYWKEWTVLPKGQVDDEHMLTHACQILTETDAKDTGRGPMYLRIGDYMMFNNMEGEAAFRRFAEQSSKLPSRRDLEEQPGE